MDLREQQQVDPDLADEVGVRPVAVGEVGIGHADSDAAVEAAPDEDVGLRRHGPVVGALEAGLEILGRQLEAGEAGDVLVGEDSGEAVLVDVEFRKLVGDVLDGLPVVNAGAEPVLAGLDAGRKEKKAERQEKQAERPLRVWTSCHRVSFLSVATLPSRIASTCEPLLSASSIDGGSSVP